MDGFEKFVLKLVKVFSRQLYGNFSKAHWETLNYIRSLQYMLHVDIKKRQTTDTRRRAKKVI